MDNKTKSRAIIIITHTHTRVGLHRNCRHRCRRWLLWIFFEMGASKCVGCPNAVVYGQTLFESNEWCSMRLIKCVHASLRMLRRVRSISNYTRLFLSLFRYRRAQWHASTQARTHARTRARRTSRGTHRDSPQYASSLYCTHTHGRRDSSDTDTLSAQRRQTTTCVCLRVMCAHVRAELLC